MPADHKCAESNCSGSKIHGLNLTCRKCLNPFFFECLAKRPEIIELLKLLNTDTANHSPTSVNHANSVMNKLFNRESSFIFICPTCNTSNPMIDLTSKPDTQSEELKRQLTNEKKRATRAETKAEKLQQQINELQKSDTKSSNFDEIQSNALINDLRSRVTSLESVVEEVQHLLITQRSRNTALLDLFDQCRGEIAIGNNVFEAIANALHGMPSSSSSAVNDDQNDVRPHHQSTPVTTHLIESPSSKNQNKFRSCETKGPSNNEQKYTNDSSSTKNQYANSLLKPPTTKKSNVINNADKNSVYEIYVSKFDPSITSESITKHIIDSTAINSNDLFIVKPLITSKEELNRKNYVSFKIMTLKRDVCDMILDKSIWSPHFEAKMFIDNAKRVNNIKSVKFAPKNGVTPSKSKQITPGSNKINASRHFSSRKSSVSNNNYNNYTKQQHSDSQFTYNQFTPTRNQPRTPNSNQNFYYSHNIPQPPILQLTGPLQQQNATQSQQQHPNQFIQYQQMHQIPFNQPR